MRPSEHTALSARRVPVTEEKLRGIGRYDYADAFEVRVPDPDQRSAEQWLRCGFGQAPPALRWTIVVAHRHVLGFRLAPVSSPDHVVGWTVVDAQPDVIHLEAASPLLSAAMVGRRANATTTTLTTCLTYERPRAAQVWRMLGPLHRRIAPYLLNRAAAMAGGVKG